MDFGDRTAAFLPIEQELGERLTWFIRLRWLAGLGILGFGAATVRSETGATMAVVSGIAAFVLVSNGCFLWWSNRAGPESRGLTGKYARTVYLQIAADWGALSLLVHLTGGIRSFAALAYTFHLIIGAILLPRRTCFVLATFASALLGVIAVVGDPAASPVLAFGGDTPPLSLWLAFSGTFFVSAFLTTSITSELRVKEAALTRSEQECEHAAREMTSLYGIGQLVNATLDLDRILGLISENAAKLTDSKGSSIQLLDERAQELKTEISYGLSSNYVRKGRIKVTESPTASLALEGRIVVVDDTEASGLQYPEAARREGIASLVCVPMRANEESIGLLRVYSGSRGAFTERDQVFLQNLANLGALAIQNARHYAQVKNLSEEKIWFARSTTHQLRSPLASVQSMLDVFGYAGPLTDRQSAFLTRCRARITEGLDMVRDLLEYAAVEGSSEKPAVPVRLQPELQGVFDSVSTHAAAAGVRFEVEDDLSGIVVMADPEDVRRIFANLLENGVKYSSVGKDVRFSATVEDERVVVRVKDSGMGIPIEDQDRIFEGFYRSEQARQGGKPGVGLGLAIVKRLVVRWGGRIELQSVPGEGSVFTVVMPGVSTSSNHISGSAGDAAH